MRDWWYHEHLVVRDDSWRERIGGWFYRIGDRIWGPSSCHEVRIRDETGAELMHFTARIPSFNMPPKGYSVWCCEGRIDDGEGGIR